MPGRNKKKKKKKNGEADPLGGRGCFDNFDEAVVEHDGEMAAELLMDRVGMWGTLAQMAMQHRDMLGGYNKARGREQSAFNAGHALSMKWPPNSMERLQASVDHSFLVPRQPRGPHGQVFPGSGRLFAAEGVLHRLSSQTGNRRNHGRASNAKHRCEF